MIIYCDIDGVLCNNTDGDYDEARPFPEAIARINQLYVEGHHIVLWTARGTTTGTDWRELTQRQLTLWGVRYHRLLLGKPYYDLLIDDRARSAL